MLPVQWLLDRKISPGDFLTGLTGSIPSASGAAYAWGWSALRNGDGFAADGSYVYGATLYGRSPAADPQFRDLLARVTGGLAQFAYGDTVSEPAIAAFNRTIALLREAASALPCSFLPSRTWSIAKSPRAPKPSIATCSRSSTASRNRVCNPA